MNSEKLHATDPNGHYIKTEERGILLREMQDHAKKHGDAHLAVPVVHIILTTSDGLVRLVQRGDKPENPFMWDKAVGGHVVTDDTSLSRQAFDDNAKKEIAEEIGITQITIAEDALHYQRLRHSGGFDFQREALLRLIDYDPWQGAVARVRGGEPWLKRSNTMTYAGIFDGPFRFMDGEAIAERTMAKGELLMEIRQTPWKYADGARVFMERYFHLI
ncbi:MAG: NUDIX domain-containing protein [Magnetococcales bacterium]|nr:NUDIX domain-containing protein [Magnetococcales bacterium]